MAKRVLMGGNEALGEGAIRAGCDAYYGYPITPQNELTAYMALHMPQHERVFIQAESEIAAISMVFGSAAAGKRAMTSSSSPGISLKQEGISYMAGSELPGLIVNIQRAGPGLGGIDPSQADYFQATRGGGHGGYRTIVLAPYSVQEMHDMPMLAFDLADKYRIPVMILGDGQLGQMMEPLVLTEKAPAPPPKPWALTGAAGRPRNKIYSYYAKTALLEEHNKRLVEKYHAIENAEVRFETTEMDDAVILVVAYGTSARLVGGAIAQARKLGIRAGMVRPQTLWPFPTEVIRAYAPKVKAVLTVELCAGQMVEDVRLAVEGRTPVHHFGRLGGAVPSVTEVLAKIKELA
jgi:2-oxoglutarate ferredoxin oxidoreductase subunit alpha